eukprot:7377257-Prymnesium_polylepis.3
MHPRGGLALEHDEITRNIAHAVQMQREEAGETRGCLPLHLELCKHWRALVEADLLAERHLRAKWLQPTSVRPPHAA